MKFWVKKIFSVNFMQILSLNVRAAYLLVSQKMLVVLNIVLIHTVGPLEQQRDKKPQWLFHEMESENETRGAEDNFTGVSAVTIECNNAK